MYVRVDVTAGAKREIVEKREENRFDIMVRQEAKRNLANGRVREILADQFLVSVGDVKLVAGHRSPRKVFDINLTK